jgi:PHP family Zn ribbon phosphoesterase
MPRLGKYQFRATCEECNRKYNADGLLSGHAICNRCYDVWFAPLYAKQLAEHKAEDEMKAKEEEGNKSRA